MRTEQAWALAERVCTPGELEVLSLRDRGMTQVAVALHLRISRSTVRSREWNARRKIDLALTSPAPTC